LHLLIALIAQDGGLDGGAVCHGIVGLDALVELLVAVEEVLEQLLHLGDMGGAVDEHDVMDGALVQESILASWSRHFTGSVHLQKRSMLSSSKWPRVMVV
jgi:hypothetical protein